MTKSSTRRWPLFRYLADILQDRFLLPTKRLIMLLFLGTPIAVAGYLLGTGYQGFWMYNGLIVLACLIDWFTLPRRTDLSLQRTIPEQTDLGHSFQVGIRLHNKSGQFLGYSIVDDLPITFKEAGLLQGQMEGTEADITYSTQGNERGQYLFQWVYMRWQGRVGLWWRQSRFSAEQSIRVYPDLSAVRGYLASLQDSLIVDGKKIMRRARAGSEFHAIREYGYDDDPRMINWSASARTRRLMTNQYRPEQGKVVTIMLDCGRLMGVEWNGRTRLDSTLEAAMTLAAVALRQGDQVALLVYSNVIKTYIPPGKGLRHLHVLLEATYDLRSDFVESDPAKALEYLYRQQKKRSLMVLFSDMENYLVEDQLGGHLWRLRRSHLLLLLSLADPLLHGWSKGETASSHIAYVKAVAQRFQLDRRAFQQKMTGAGIQVLDVPADQLTVTLINTYLEIKSRDAL
ncbi:hypothetical protein AN963_23075 [Brevibacillus choshinensis]|uniref:DUF58 domain-containing protein n=1 Tax=Brevibacillus choshinensis TaxID=54911 RepID=A0ABR5N1B7_BRECH|nr:DUF58 domain-containing protein [Brevibacillus choshinensis]KQL44295.1 hypothetical protein AN963_23075 [Brevibacillus choshinensis]